MVTVKGASKGIHARVFATPISNYIPFLPSWTSRVPVSFPAPMAASQPRSLANWVSERVLPSGSKNYATRFPAWSRCPGGPAASRRSARSRRLASLKRGRRGLDVGRVPTQHGESGAWHAVNRGDAQHGSAGVEDQRVRTLLDQPQPKGLGEEPLCPPGSLVGRKAISSALSSMVGLLPRRAPDLGAS